ncbi:hypothetical protein GCM10028895_15880 [Pontibacter rugosus]
MRKPRLLHALALSALLCVGSTTAKAQEFSRQDTLRGSITPERAWWDLTFYDLDIAVNIQDSTLQGSNTIRYKVLEPHQRLQVDLQPPMRIKR